MSPSTCVVVANTRRIYFKAICFQECDLGQKSVLHAVKTRRRIPKHMLGMAGEASQFKSISESLLEQETSSSGRPSDRLRHT